MYDLSKNFLSSEVTYEEYEKCKKLKKRLIKEYRGKKLEDVIEGEVFNTESGSCYLIEDRTFLRCEIIDPVKAKLKILSNFRLIYGIGELNEIILKEKGYRTIEDLMGHYRFGEKAKEFLNIINSCKYNQLINNIEHWFPKSHPLVLFSSSFFSKEDFIILDIETLGLFNRPIILIGMAKVTEDSIVVKQYLPRDVSEESAILSGFLSNISKNNIFITFNGRTFDIPYIQQRLAYYGMQGDLNKPNYDVLHFSRRAWREKVDNCKLGTLEKFFFGIERRDDIPSSMVPDFYEAYLKNGNVGLLLPIISHNKQDLITLANLFSKLHIEWEND